MSNINIMKYVILTFKWGPSPTTHIHQISVESTQIEHIQSTFKPIDSPACKKLQLLKKLIFGSYDPSRSHDLANIN